MVNTCVVQFCRNSNYSGHSLHSFPKDPSLRRQWVRFVRTKTANFPKPGLQSVICSEHFTPDSFTGGLMSEMGFKCKKLLKAGSVPTIQPVPTPEQIGVAKGTKRKLGSAAEPGNAPTSLAPPQKVPKLRRAFVKRRVAEILQEASSVQEVDLEPADAESLVHSESCQTEKVPGHNKGTQLSALKCHYRSKGINVACKMVDKSSQTDSTRTI